MRRVLQFRSTAGAALKQVSAPGAVPAALRARMATAAAAAAARPTSAAAAAAMPARDVRLKVTEQAGVRFISLNRAQTFNVLNVSLMRRLISQLEAYERNDAVQVVVLQSEDRSVFSGGVNLEKVQQLAADPATRAEALEFFKEEARLALVLATYTKPLVVAQPGLSMSSLSLLPKFRISTPSSMACFPQVKHGMIPTGGATYALSRMGKGVGMYMATTGEALQGAELYYAGSTTHHTDPSYFDNFFQDALTRVTSSHTAVQEIERNSVYQKSMDALAKGRAKARLSLAMELSEGAFLDFREYIRLKLWNHHMRSGDHLTAATMLRANLTARQMGEYLDIGGPREMDGYTRPMPPAFQDAHGRVGNAVDQATLLNGPLSAASQHKLDTIARCFGGDASKGDPMIKVRFDPMLDFMAHKKANVSESDFGDDFAPCPITWEASLPKGLEFAVLDAMITHQVLPDNADLAKMVEVARGLVPECWPAGQPSENMLQQALEGASLSASEQNVKVLATTVLRVTAGLQKVSPAELIKRHEVSEKGLSGFVDRIDEEDSEAILAKQALEYHGRTKLRPRTPVRLPSTDNVTFEQIMEQLDAVQDELEGMTSHLPDGFRNDDADTPLPAHLNEIFQEREMDLDRLSSPTSLLDEFGIPRAKGLRTFAKRLTEAIKVEKEVARGLPQPRSVDEIVRRLKAEDTPFARQTLKALQSASPTAVKVAHSLITQASVAPIVEVLTLEVRAAARLLQHPDFAAGLHRDSTSAPWAAAVPDAGVSSFFEPLDAEEPRLHFRDDLVLGNRRAELEYLNQLEQWYESGEGDDYIGNLLATRYVWA